MDTTNIRKQIKHLSSMSLTSDGSRNAPITKRNLEDFRDEVVKVLNQIVKELES